MTLGRGACQDLLHPVRLPPAQADSAPGLSTSGVLSSCMMSCWQGSLPTVFEKCCGFFTLDAGLSFVLSCSTEKP